jgi:hypothetical protein
MLGYETRLLTQHVVNHLKPRNIAEGGMLRRTWQLGVRDYALGYLPLFELFKCLSRLLEPPLVIGTFIWWAGYCCAAIRCQKRHLPKDLLEFTRAEQVRRLKRMMRLPCS